MIVPRMPKRAEEDPLDAMIRKVTLDLQGRALQRSLDAKRRAAAAAAGPPGLDIRNRPPGPLPPPMSEEQKTRLLDYVRSLRQGADDGPAALWPPALAGRLPLAGPVPGVPLASAAPAPPPRPGPAAFKPAAPAPRADYGPLPELEPYLRRAAPAAPMRAPAGLVPASAPAAPAPAPVPVLRNAAYGALRGAAIGAAVGLPVGALLWYLHRRRKRKRR